ncbi:MAG TPA: serine hydrolase [Bacteroidota bacterium]
MKLTLIVLCLFITTLRAQRLSDLTPEILANLNAVQGRFAVGVYGLARGESLFINPDTVFHAASTMKTPVMVELFKQAYEGRFILDDSIVVKNEFHSIVDGSSYELEVSDDSDSLMYRRIGTKMTIRALLHEMITVSSNLATNILIELVDARNVMTTMRSMGANDIRVLRGVEDIKAYRQGLNNSVTARDLVTIFRFIAERKIVHESACKEMIDILCKQKFRDVIPALLPVNTRVAHKTGSITGVEHDSGIVYLPNGEAYVVVLLSKNLSDPKAGKQALAEVSKRIYDYFAKGN